MGWERYALAAGPVFIFQIAAIQTVAVFDDQLLSLLEAFKDWQSLVAALIAIAGIGWQVERQGRLVREQMAHAKAIADSERRAEQVAIIRPVRLAVVGIVLCAARNRGAMEAFVTPDHGRFVYDVIARVWRSPDTRQISMIQSKLGSLGPVADLIYILLDRCQQIESDIFSAKQNPPNALGRLFLALGLCSIYQSSAEQCESLALLVLQRLSDEFGEEFAFGSTDLELQVRAGREAAEAVIAELAANR